VPPTEVALLWLFTDDPAAGLLAGIGCIQHPKVIALRAFEKLADESFGPRNYTRQPCLVPALWTDRSISGSSIWHAECRSLTVHVAV
jgi:hypothetical protein